jgi:hypothetical protein
VLDASIRGKGPRGCDHRWAAFVLAEELLTIL